MSDDRPLDPTPEPAPPPPPPPPAAPEKKSKAPLWIALGCLGCGGLTVFALIAAGAVGWVLSGDEEETAMEPVVVEQPAATPAPAPAPAEAPAPAPAGGYRAGDAVQILWEGQWYPGEILEVDGSRYKIRYDGYDASWDEWVTTDRLRPA